MPIKTYQGDDGAWTIADDGGWCPGVYDSEATARYLHRRGVDVMAWKWKRHQRRHGIPTPPMSRDDIRADDRRR